MEIDIVLTILGIMFLPSIAINAISWIYLNKHMNKKLIKFKKDIANLRIRNE